MILHHCFWIEAVISHLAFSMGEKSLWCVEIWIRVVLAWRKFNHRQCRVKKHWRLQVNYFCAWLGCGSSARSSGLCPRTWSQWFMYGFDRPADCGLDHPSIGDTIQKRKNKLNKVVCSLCFQQLRRCVIRLENYCVPPGVPPKSTPV